MLLDDVGIPIIHPRYAAASGWTDTSSYLTQASPSYHWNAVANIMYEMKTGNHALVPSRQQQPLPLNDDATTASPYYELPDGTKVDLNRHEQLRRLPELFFTDPAGASSSSSTSSSIPRKTLSDITCRNDLSIPKLVHNAISNVDVDLRKELCSNIVLCGASSLHPGLEQRLSEELSIKLPKAAKCRVICARSIERQFSSWIGASILTSLGSFQQMWISKLEYEEYGAALTIQRCP
jgi:actin-related protein